MRLKQNNTGKNLITYVYDNTSQKLTVSRTTNAQDLVYYEYWTAKGSPSSVSAEIANTLITVALILKELSTGTEQYAILPPSGTTDFTSLNTGSVYMLYAVNLRNVVAGYSGSDVDIAHQLGLVYFPTGEPDILVNSKGGTTIVISTSDKADYDIVKNTDLYEQISLTDEYVEIYAISTTDPILETLALQSGRTTLDAVIEYAYTGVYDPTKTKMGIAFGVSPGTPGIVGASPLYYTGTSEGTYTYIIEIYDSLGVLLTSKTDSFNMSIYLNAMFHATLDYTNPKTFTFVNYSLGGATSWNWDFGDGSTSPDEDPGNHTYDDDGIYTVTLIISKAGVPDSTFTTNVSVGTLSCIDLVDTDFHRTACHEYTLKVEEYTNHPRTIYVKDMNENIISEYTAEIGVDLISITTPKDGAWIIESWYDKDGTFTLISQYPLYDLCDAYNCYMTLINSMHCPTNSECDEILKEEQMVREALNRLSGMMYFLDQLIRLESDSYLGIHIIEETRMSKILDVQNLFDKLELTINNCSSCCGETTSDDSECSTCN